MSFPRYPAYKNSGVEWLGEVPEHWEQKKIKFLASFSGGGTPNRENLDYWNGDIPWVSPKDMKSESILTTEESITIEGLQNSASSLIQKNLILMVVRSGILKHTIPIALNKISVSLNQDMKAIAFNSTRIISIFFLRWVQGLNRELLAVWSKQGATVESLEHDYIANTVIALPTLPEQHTIAAFLDRETAKIDALVAEQEKLIALLAEKRQATISHAVTKGLNPAVPMKDSGIEWLGAVPEHWEISRVKHIILSLEQGWSPQCEGYPTESPDEWGVLKVGCVNGGIFNSRENKVLPAELEPITALTINSGDVLISRANTRELVGGAATAMEDYPRLMLCDKLYRLRLNPKLSVPKFLVQFLGTPQARGQIELAATGASSSMLNIGQSTILEMTTPLPPLAEQQAIVAHLDRETARLDALTAEARRAIDLLKERRSALISAAVTGKIDVRGTTMQEAS